VLQFIIQNNRDFIDKATLYLSNRLNGISSQKTVITLQFFVSGGALANGFPDRYSEFQDFEQKFEECISKFAVRTKFEQPSQSGKLIVSEIRQIMDNMYDPAQQLKTQKAVAKKEIYDKLEGTKQQLLLLTQAMNSKIQQMVEDVEQRVSYFRGTSVTSTEGTQCWVHVVLMNPYLFFKYQCVMGTAQQLTKILHFSL